MALKMHIARRDTTIGAVVSSLIQESHRRLSANETRPAAPLIDNALTEANSTATVNFFLKGTQLMDWNRSQMKRLCFTRAARL